MVVYNVSEVLIETTRYTKEYLSKIPRIILLLVYVFSIRLQDEDFTFITHFLRRHLKLKAAFREPYYLQDISPAAKTTVRQLFVEAEKHSRDT